MILCALGLIISPRDTGGGSTSGKSIKMRSNLTIISDILLLFDIFDFTTQEQTETRNAGEITLPMILLCARCERAVNE